MWKKQEQGPLAGRPALACQSVASCRDSQQKKKVRLGVRRLRQCSELPPRGKEGKWHCAGESSSTTVHNHRQSGRGQNTTRPWPWLQPCSGCGYASEGGGGGSLTEAQVHCTGRLLQPTSAVAVNQKAYEPMRGAWVKAAPGRHCTRRFILPSLESTKRRRFQVRTRPLSLCM